MAEYLNENSATIVTVGCTLVDQIYDRYNDLMDFENWTSHRSGGLSLSYKEFQRFKNSVDDDSTTQRSASESPRKSNLYSRMMFYKILMILYNYYYLKN